tara:strand:- start:762 stop:1052 length:291 start_codon:yes stop_codon:yes gene_type:complete
MRNTYIVTYDICDSKRLRRVYEKMRAWGDHLQLSVFECHLTKMELAKARGELKVLIHQDEDQILFVDLGPADGRGDRAISALGRPYSSVCAPLIVV